MNRNSFKFTEFRTILKLPFLTAICFLVIIGIIFTTLKAFAGEGASPCGNGKVFNVKNYGAVGDGKTDDSRAFQAAVNAAYKAGGAAYAPAATYAINGAVNVVSTGIFGDGPGKTILVPFLPATGRPLLALLGQGACVSRLTLDGANNAEFPLYSVGMYVEGANSFSIENCSFVNAFTWAVSVNNGSTNGAISNNVFNLSNSKNPGEAVSFIGSSDIQLIYNTFYVAPSWGAITASNPPNVSSAANCNISINGNIFSVSSGASPSIYLYNATNCSITGNEFTASANTPSPAAIWMLAQDGTGPISGINITGNFLNNMGNGVTNAIGIQSHCSSAQPVISSINIQNNNIIQSPIPNAYPPGTSGGYGIYTIMDAGTNSPINNLNIAGNTFTNTVFGCFISGANNVNCSSNNIGASGNYGGEGIRFYEGVGGACSINANKLYGLGGTSYNNHAFSRGAIDVWPSTTMTSLSIQYNTLLPPKNDLQYFIYDAISRSAVQTSVFGNVTGTTLPNYIAK